MNQKTIIEPINTSLSRFGVQYENQFNVLDDAKHVIGIDASDPSKLIIENIETRKADKFGWTKSSLYYYFTTLLYDEDTGFLYSGDDCARLYKYKIDKTSKSCERVKAYGNLRIGCITSSHRFMHYVFFGGYDRNIKVLDLLTGKLLPGDLETSIGCICSLQVCLKSKDEIYLAVSGTYYDYSDDKIDLFNLTDLFLNDPLILQKYL